MRLPVRLGGFGFRSLEDMAGIAFIGALEQAVPALSGEDGICCQLEEVMGGQECFGEDAPADQRWRVMLASDSREGEELRRVWANLKQEELEATVCQMGQCSDISATSVIQVKTSLSGFHRLWGDTQVMRTHFFTFWTTGCVSKMAQKWSILGQN